MLDKVKKMGKLDQKKQENVIYWSIDQCKKAHLAYFRDTKAWFRLNLHFGEYLKPGFVLDKVKKRGEKLTKEQEFGPDTWQNTLLLDNKVKKRGKKAWFRLYLNLGASWKTENTLEILVLGEIQSKNGKKFDQKKQENVIYWSIDQCKKAHLAYFRDTKVESSF